ncbi:pyruvate dehydrogenase (acetyl-transferring) E1 component subunit alpha [Stutzerimonas frequens]|uniref:Thiamine pyrophosphate-dependent dehydrogenase E1 component subunit alpha n=1 Tax=Stutzerimonas frequens TaxID=2968969 RepID=A0ABX6XTR4_9GAMM|nr:thiamine pyrophosphate-dependent dehydrogenase E1 component subunit alpha [Stutzerimonas frequens]MCQ4305302.1 thiamine pyrophosphate-dependent dehydrogenase E1 component subunit alpha [Stutzerimonas frequens]PNF50618.1 pyruvate dehydrogenase (acetyl-transferring) E1 component subunit alpha [Stutzerimonas frequens]QPT17427.1 thiamine pyrophosphate-dependent dehydrogenase E1 component subunit alpha [Stutzerimonas frequens]WCR43312.1 thiamine pyrophosphate-dependent dehydrogenase E1 component 
MTQPTPSQRLWMYEQMLTSRYMEESIERIYMEGKTPVFNMAKGPIPGEMHLSNGQEPCAVGVCAHLEAADIVTATHRPHHIAVAKGVDLNEMMAEIFGKATGLSGGRGGHMHLFDGRVNFSCSGIIAEGMGPAVGAALSRQMQGKPGVAVSFIGEGAANQGAFHETLNLAALWKLPVVFVIEDNAWGISVAKASATCIKQHHVRAAAYGMPGVFVENNDPDGVFRAAGEAIERARAGGGPTLIEIETYRLAGHFMGDGETYRPEGEKDGLMKKDPIPGYRQRLIDEGVMTEAQAEDIAARARGRIDEAVEFARESPYPRPEEALEQVFV